MSEEKTRAVMDQYNDAFLKNDPSLLDGLLAEDCVLENSAPAPDGSRHVGRAECLEFWSKVAGNEQMEFELEDMWVAGDRAVIRGQLRWGTEPQDWVRGVNLMRVRDGLIVEGLGYAKGQG